MRRGIEYSGIARLPVAIGEWEEHGVSAIVVPVVIIFLLIVANGLFVIEQIASAERGSLPSA